MATVTHFKGRDSYLKLVRDFPLCSIRSHKHHQQALKVVDRLIAKRELSDGESLYVDALSDLIASYEDKHYPIGPVSDADMLRHLMDARQVSQAELHRHTKIPKSTISEILAGKKSFTRSIIRTLAEYFKVGTDVFTTNL